MLIESGQRFVGIGVDSAKGQLEIGVLPVEQYWKASNDEAGRRTVSERLREIEPTLIVLEATNGYETPVAIQLVAVGLPVIVMTPALVREFARNKIPAAKSTGIDARAFALCAQTISPKVRPIKDQQRIELDKLFMRRRQLIDMITVEKKRMIEAVKGAGKNISAHTAHIVWLEKSLDDVNIRLKTLINLRHRACARFCVNGGVFKSPKSAFYAEA